MTKGRPRSLTKENLENKTNCARCVGIRRYKPDGNWTIHAVLRLYWRDLP
jgi:hypothetical protein